MTRTRLTYLLLLKAAVMLLFILFSPVGLSPDEAQYWTWSQALDLGYYSKPPGIAWQIWLTTKLFGSTVLGVRFGALIIAFALPWVIYVLARRAGCAFWGAVVTAFMPLGFYLSLAATTDGGALLFLALAITALPHLPLAGLCIGLGALFKWTVFAFWPFVICFRAYRKRGLGWGILISLLALIPTLYWNMGHDFATFRHVARSVSRPGSNFFDFLGAQLGLLSPIFAILLIVGWFRARQSLRFSAVFTMGILLFLAMGLFKHMQPNWGIFFYAPAGAVIAYAGMPQKSWLHLGTWVSIVMVAAALVSPYLPIPYKLSPFRQNLGWTHLTTALEKTDADFLFADRYQMASLLSFYSPEQRRAYFFNLGDSRRNQFSYWPGMETQVGKTGIFVIAENRHEDELAWYEEHYLKRLAPYFATVEYLGPTSLVPGEKYALFFRCVDYNGKVPGATTRF